MCQHFWAVPFCTPPPRPPLPAPPSGPHVHSVPKRRTGKLAGGTPLARAAGRWPILPQSLAAAPCGLPWPLAPGPGCNTARALCPRGLCPRAVLGPGPGPLSEQHTARQRSDLESSPSCLCRGGHRTTRRRRCPLCAQLGSHGLSRRLPFRPREAARTSPRVFLPVKGDQSCFRRGTAVRIRVGTHV